ncbi:MAG TPA: PilZ domain-containing protein [Pyrinomonadaceae bacterium]|nr:PilZ domain-containing protein [Pyrinomonadaceae bacterium]
MSYIARLRKYIGERRAAPRYVTRLEKSVTVYVYLLDPKTGAETGRGARLVGYTRDVSETGLGVILPEVRVAGRSIVREGRELRLLVGIPHEPVEMQAAVVRHVRLEKGELDGGYLVGVHITSMGEADRARYAKYLSKLAVNDI